MTTGLAATTWADLSALTGSTAGEAAWVFGPDAGTHTDPVTSATVSNVGVYAWSVSPAGWQQVAPLSASAETFIVVTDPPPTPDTGTSQIALEYIYPDRVDGDGTHSDIPARISVSYGPYAAGDVPGAPKFTDLGLNIGFNATGSGSPQIAGQPVFETRMEYKFYGASPEPGNPVIPWCEFHVQLDTVQGDFIRPYSLTAPWNTSDWNYASSQSWRSASYAWYAGNGVDFVWEVTAHGSAGTASPVVSLGPNTTISQPVNGVPMLSQKNAAGTTLRPLWYLDHLDQCHLGQSIYQTIDTWPASNGFGISAYTIVGGPATPNNALLRPFFAGGGTAPANVTDLYTEQAASTLLRWRINNTHASGEARLDITGSGDQSVRFTHTASGRNGTFKLTNSGQRFEVDKPVKFPTYTVDTLPAAGTAGAGARAFVSDANATTFNSVVAGGGANFVPVFSDGTNWNIG